MKDSRKNNRNIDPDYRKKKLQDKRRSINMRKKRRDIQSMKNLSKA